MIVVIAGIVLATAMTAPLTSPAAGSTSRPITASEISPVIDPALETGLDGVISLSPSDTCLRVDVGGRTIYSHGGQTPLIPASTRKLLTAAVALDLLGPSHRYRTTVMSPPPVAGVINGDLTLVGGGDPTLTTSAYAFVRRIDPDQAITRLDTLADAVAASGVKEVRGRVLGDESRYDSQRVVSLWPERYVSQEQVGPLSALDLDQGYRLDLRSPDAGGPRRVRSVDPAAEAAATFAAMLVERGIEVDGGSAAGNVPVGTVELAGIDSEPLTGIVREMLEQSDNLTAELLTKEIGKTVSGSGTTAAGTAAVTTRARELGLTTDKTVVADGSGLARENRATCDELVKILESSGASDGPLGRGLAVAGRTGTLRARFKGTPAEGRLKAKTGSLNDVSALAGFVTMSDGREATFSYIANGPQAEDPRRGQDFLGVLLGQYEPVCDKAQGAMAMTVPLAGYAAQVGALAAAPIAVAMIPVVTVGLDSFQERGRDLVGSCLRDDPGFLLTFPR